MAAPRPKSPRPIVSPKKDDKEESFWEKIGTLGRKKRIKEGICKQKYHFLTNLNVLYIEYDRLKEITLYGSDCFRLKKMGGYTLRSSLKVL